MEVKIGDRIRIYHLKGEDGRYDGAEGIVEHIDGIGQLHGTWEVWRSYPTRMTFRSSESGRTTGEFAASSSRGAASCTR